MWVVLIVTQCKSTRPKFFPVKEDDDTITQKIIAECGIDPQTAESAAAVIQRAFKDFQTRQSNLLYGTIDWRVAARSAIQLYRKTGVSPEEAKRAATLIKAAYKGYYTRKALQSLRRREEEIESSAETFEIKSPSLSAASTEKKSKVRIDFSTVLPRVNFDDERHLEVIFEETLEYQEDTKDLSETSKTSLENFMRKLIETQALR